MGLEGKVKEIGHDFHNTSYLHDETPTIGGIIGLLSCRPETEKSDKNVAL